MAWEPCRAGSENHSQQYDLGTCLPFSESQLPQLYNRVDDFSVLCVSAGRSQASSSFPPSNFSSPPCRLPLQCGGRGPELLLGAEGEECSGTSPSRYDDYDYGEVNQLLERNLKVYIKTVACYPEKVHVNLLLLEARMQAALLYALRAITRYMT